MVTMDLDRIADSFTVGDGCWQWQRALDDRGYGRVGAAKAPAHRFMYELLVGPIPEGMFLDHLCRNKACVNPGHLEPVTNAENQRRGDAAKLTWEDVRFIRAHYSRHHRDCTLRALAARFGVTHGAVHKIVHHRAWVDDPAIEGGQ